ncbi:hypothetical protein [Actinomadura gamaensis]|uniref:Uncharacterized protein n=1 Tax=Actinomadura gamaensis TaxID=1763541 RepID=A0ABV9TSE1_9ACTN
MKSQLHDALHELAEGAPSRVSLDGVLAGARRRKRIRLVAVPSVAAVAAAAVLMGAVLVGGGTEPAGPAEQPDRPLVTGPGKLLNPPGVLPGPLPKGEVEPIVLGFLDHCGKKGRAATSAAGDCAQWRLVGRSGRQWRLADGIGSTTGKPGDYMNSDAEMAISPDGLRLAYYRAADRRLVARDLSTGKVTVIGEGSAGAQLPGSFGSLMFCNDGTRLAITWGEPGQRRTLLADVRTGALTALPPGDLIGFSEDASTIVLGNVWNSKEPLTVAGPDGAVRARVTLDPKARLNGSSGSLLSPDGRTLVVPSLRLDKAMLVDVRTGKITSVRPVRGGVGIPRGWTGPSTYFRPMSPPMSDVPRGDDAGATDDMRGTLVDLTTGKFTYTGPNFRIRAWRSAVIFGGFLS